MKNEIPKIVFKQSPKMDFDFEILPLSRLFHAYIKGEILDHSITAPHRVDFNMVLFITNGEGAHYIDFQAYSYKKGSILFLTKGQIQAWEVNETNDGFIIIFSEAFIQKSLGFSHLLQYHRLFNYQLYRPVFQLDNPLYQEFLDIFLTIQKEFHEQNDFAKEKIIGALMTFFLLKAERLTRKISLPTNNEAYQKLFIDFKNLLFKNYKNSRNAAYYADNLGVSYKHLNNVCKAIINKTAKEFINTFLILEIKRILISSGISIKELTYQMGFDEPTNFVKFFKKHSQQTPAQFRKSNQK